MGAGRGGRRGFDRRAPQPLAGAPLAGVAAVELLDQSIDRLEERLGDLSGNHVADRILGPECGSRPHRHLTETTRLVVAETVGHGLEIRDPAVRAPLPRGRDDAVDQPSRRQSGLVNARELVPKRTSTTARGGQADGRRTSRISHVDQASGRVTNRGSRFRSEPLTRIRNE